MADPEVGQVDFKWKVTTAATLCFLHFIYYMDRFGIAGLLVELQCQFGVGDDEGGYVQSAFILSFLVAAPLVGFAGDRWSRKVILVCGMALWSGLTLGSTFVAVDSFGVFVALRALTGVGEASFSTLAPAIISDLFARDQRARYLAAYALCIPVGSGLGFIAASQVAAASGSWRWGLRVTPVLGLVAVVLIVLLVRDPQRGASEGSRLAASGWRRDVGYLATNWSYVHLVVATTCVSFFASAVASWGPKLLSVAQVAELEQDATSSSTISTVFGAVTMAAAVTGVVGGSALSQRLRLRWPTADPLVCAFGFVLCAPLFFLVVWQARGPLVVAYLIAFVGQVLGNLNWAIASDIAMYVVIPPRRATAKALQLLVMHLLGDAGSPIIVGLISESLKSTRSESDCDGGAIDPETALEDFTALQYAMFLPLFVAVVAAAGFFAVACTVVDDKRRAQLAVGGDIGAELRAVPSAEKTAV